MPPLCIQNLGRRYQRQQIDIPVRHGFPDQLFQVLHLCRFKTLIELAHGKAFGEKLLQFDRAGIELFITQRLCSRTLLRSG